MHAYLYNVYLQQDCMYHKKKQEMYLASSSTQLLGPFRRAEINHSPYLLISGINTLTLV